MSRRKYWKIPNPLNVNMDMTIKNVRSTRSDIKIVSTLLNAQILKMV